MNAAQSNFESADLDRLNDKDKADLRQFLANEQQRSQIQAREFRSYSAAVAWAETTEGIAALSSNRDTNARTLCPETHNLTQTCWKKCVTGSIRDSKLDKSEETCLANCVDRFLDLNFLTMKHLNNMRS